MNLLTSGSEHFETFVRAGEGKSKDLLGRSGLIRELLEAIVAPGHGAVLVGPGGSGKSSLVTLALREFSSQNQNVEIARFRGTEATAASPLAVFISVLGNYEDLVNERPEQVSRKVIEACLTLAAERTGARKASADQLIIWIDDVFLLDNMSLLVLEALMARTDVRIILTCRHTPPIPAVVVRAWREGLMAQIKVTALTSSEVEAIVQQVLPGKQFSPETMTRFEKVSGGNPLFLIELLRGLNRDQNFEERRGIWVWRDGFPEHTTITDIIRSEIDKMPPETRAVFETIALCAPISLELLGAGADLEIVSELADIGVVEFSPNLVPGHSVTVNLAHPIYGETVSSLFNSAQKMSRFRALYDGAREKFGPVPGPDDVLSVVAWGLQGGSVLPLELLTQAFEMTSKVADYEFRIRVATAVIRHDQTGLDLRVRALLSRLEAYRFSDNPQGVTADCAAAARLLEEMDPSLERDELIITLGCLAADSFVLQRSSWREALAILDWAKDLITISHDAWRLDIARGVTLSFAGKMAQSFVLQERLYNDHPGDPELLPLVSTTIITLAQRGESKRARALARQQMTLALRNTKQHPLAVGDLVGAWCLADMIGGNLREASVIYGLLNVAIERNPGNVRVRKTLVAFGRGLLALSQGQWPNAVENLKLAGSELEDFTGTGSEGLLLASLAHAQAAEQDYEGSLATRQEFEIRSAETSKLLELPARYSLLLADLYAPNGSETDQAKELVRIARASEFKLMELQGLHALAMTTPGGLTDPDLARAKTLAGEMDSPLAPLLVDSCLHIATGAERGTGTAARALARRGLVIPLGHAAPELTSREQQLAELLALGFSNAQIAKRLVISKRTVESHAARIMQKLHVTSRDSIADALENRS